MQLRVPARLAAALAATAWLSGAAGADEEALGYVSAVAGDATAQRPGQAPRPLACGDPVYSDDTLRTASDARLGVMLDDLAAQLAADTQVGLGRTAQATPSARLVAGMVRVIDPRAGGTPARLSVLDADARVMGNDAEAYLFAEKAGPYAMLCEWDAPLPVARGQDPSRTAGPGECVVAKPTEPLYVAQAHEQRIPAAPPELCDFEVAAGSPVSHLTPADVAAPGPQMSPDVSPLAATGPDYRSCDVGGAACGLPLPVTAPPSRPVVGDPGGNAGQL